MIKIHQNRDALINLPIFLDATCSGMQHLAGMLKDVKLGNTVNISEKSFDDNVEDLYGTLVEPINNAINTYGTSNVDYINLSNIKLSRSILKTSIMTQLYNVTRHSINDQLKSKLKTVQLSNKKDSSSNKKDTLYLAPTINGGEIPITYKDLFKIAEIIEDQAFSTYPSLRLIYDYFVKIVKLLLKLNVPVTWFTPSGMKITQFYKRSMVKKVPLSYFGKYRTAVIREWFNIVNKQKQEQAIIPNIIHSLDASHLINIINWAIKENFEPIISVHDCFGTHSNKMDKLSNVIKTEFALLYTESDFLNNFHNKVITSIKDNNFIIKQEKGQSSVFINNKWHLIPQLPKQGILDLDNIRKSSYFVC